MLQTADRGPGEMAYDVSHAIALPLLYIEIVATRSQLVDTLLYLHKNEYLFTSIKRIPTSVVVFYRYATDRITIEKLFTLM